MNDLKSRIYQHFFTRKKYFILGKPPLLVHQNKDYFAINGEVLDGTPRFRVDNGMKHNYFTEVDNVVEFIDKFKEKNT